MKNQGAPGQGQPESSNPVRYLDRKNGKKDMLRPFFLLRNIWKKNKISFIFRIAQLFRLSTIRIEGAIPTSFSSSLTVALEAENRFHD